MDGNAFWIIQCSQHFYESYESSIKTIYWDVCGSYYDAIMIYNKM